MSYVFFDVFSIHMVRSHLLNRSTLSSAIIGVVPKNLANNTPNASSPNASTLEDDNKCIINPIIYELI